MIARRIYLENPLHGQQNGKYHFSQKIQIFSYFPARILLFVPQIRLTVKTNRPADLLTSNCRQGRSTQIALTFGSFLDALSDIQSN